MSNSTIYEGKLPSLTDFLTQATGKNSIAIGQGANATLDNELVIEGNVSIRVVMTPEESAVVKRLLQRAMNER